LQPGRDHVVDCIAAGAAYAEYGNARFHFPNVRDRQVDGHVCLMSARAAGLRRAEGANAICTPPNWADPPPADPWFR
jgi:hypothetical protein